MPYQITQTNNLAAIVNAVATEVGYGASSDPAGSTDPSMKKFVSAANSAAAELISKHDWQFLKKQGSVVVQASVPGISEEAYPLPEDFAKWIDQTQNDSTQRLPAVGPVGSAVWNAIQFLDPQVTFNLFWQVRNNKLYVLAPPDEPHTVTFQYLSFGYVVDADDPTLFKNVATKNGDTFLFDYYLMERLTKAKWLEQNGFDAGAALRDFQIAFDARTGQKEGATVVNMAAPSYSWMRYLNNANVPQTGFGQ